MLQCRERTLNIQQEYERNQLQNFGRASKMGCYGSFPEEVRCLLVLTNELELASKVDSMLGR